MDPLNGQWLPSRSDIPYDKIGTFQNYEQVRLKAFVIELCNFNERSLVKYLDDRVDERVPNKMLLRYLWGSNDMLGTTNNTTGIRDPNSNKLNKKKIIRKQDNVPSSKYIYKPKYHLNEGWCEFQNVDGYGTCDSLFDVFESDFGEKGDTMEK